MRPHILLGRLGAAALLLATAGCATATAPARPATGELGGGPDPELYEARQAAATETFLDPGRPKAERLEAAEDLGYPEDETFDAMLAVGTDPTEDDGVRWEALRQHRFDDAYIEAVLAILADPSDGGEKLNADLIEDLGRRAFQVPPALEQQIVATLRGLLDDPRDLVRLAAFRVLGASHDTVAISRLTDALAANDSPIPLDEAIRLLDVDGSVFHIEVLRPYLEHEEVPVQAEAARALAVDPDSRPRIVELVTSVETDRQIRLRAIRALAREDERFADYAIPIVANGQESAEIRRAAMKAFVGRMNYFDVDPKDQLRFAAVVERIARGRAFDADSRKLQADARALLVYLKKAFPVIAKAYGVE